MWRGLAVLALLCIGAARPEAPPAPWPLMHFVQWQSGWGARTIEAAGLKVRVEPKKCGVDRPLSEACNAGDPFFVATVDVDGKAPVTVEGSAGVGGYVGIGPLTRGARPSAILISDNGGSSGCVQIDIAVPDRAAYRHVRLSVDPRDHGTICEVNPARLAWPRDITGHGRAEFLLVDTIFYCRFTSCAGTWYPPRVIAFDGRRGVDVSADPALAPLYRADMATARYACEHRTVEAQGACAGYAADASRLGVESEAWRVIDAQVQRGCRVRTSDVCYVSNEFPSTFPAELAAALREGGYRVPPDRVGSSVKTSRKSLGLTLISPSS